MAQREEIVAREPVVPDAARVQQIEENIREDHECAHRYFKRVNGVNGGENLCELCRSRLTGYLLECRQCQIRICVRCKRHRLREINNV